MTSHVALCADMACLQHPERSGLRARTLRRRSGCACLQRRRRPAGSCAMIVRWMKCGLRPAMMSPLSTWRPR